MPTVKGEGFKITADERGFKPIEVTLEITSKDVYDAIAYVVSKSDIETEHMVYTVYALDDDLTKDLVDALFRSIIK